MNKLITFEGIDCVGKTTQIDLFLEKLRYAKLEHILYREPGGTIFSEKILLIYLLLFKTELT